jgi:hypothetical protein
MTTTEPIDDALAGARCWGIELDPQYRVLGVTVEPGLGRPGQQPETVQLLCFPVSVLLVTVTRPVSDGDGMATELVTFDLDLLTAVSQRLAGAAIDVAAFGLPEPRPRDWGPRFSLQARTSASDGTLSTLTLDLSTDEGVRLRLFARFDDVELRDSERALITSASGAARGEGRSTGDGPDDGALRPSPSER